MGNVTTAATIAKSARIGTRTRRYVLRDEWGHPHDGARYEHVLCAIMRSDLTPNLPGAVRIAAIALHKSISTGRMNCVSSLRIQAYSPYKLCQLVARIAAENPGGTIGFVCDHWIATNHASL